MHYVYFLSHPLTLFIPIYVGITDAPARRHEEHKDDARKRVFLAFKPWMFLVGAYGTREACEHAENVWIDMCKRFRVPIRNKAKARIDTTFSLTFWIVPFLRLFWVTINKKPARG